ncbi:kinase-like domain-containing protein [Syncephalis plumigaleata]|nr:kinase-like domain-containing protein [Syncephalis plumigaleata]
MRLIAFSSSAIIGCLVAILCARRVFATPVNFVPAHDVDETSKWITLPVHKPDELERGLEIKKIIGYGKLSVMASARYYDKGVFVKCSYHSRSIKRDEKVLSKARIRSNDFARHYFVNYLHSFKIGIPYRLAAWLKKSILTGWINSVVPSFGTCIVTEYAGERTLEDYIRSLPNGEVEYRTYQLIFQLLDAIKFLHKAGIAYNDIKPEDVIVTLGPYGHPSIKLVDFDTSTLFNPDLKKPPKGYYPGRVLEYTPPEARLWGKINLLKSATWSIGAMFYRILSGRVVTGELIGRGNSYDRVYFKQALKAMNKKTYMCLQAICILVDVLFQGI